MDFSKSLMHCSTIAHFMRPGRGKTPKQLWEDALDAKEAAQQKYDALSEKLKGMKTGANCMANIEKWKAKVAELEPKRNEDPLSATAKSYLKGYYAYLKYGKWSASLDKGNKYTNKGKLGEPASIELVSFLDDRVYVKNANRFQNEYLTGEPDIVDLRPDDGVYIIDVKSSWDIETFMDNLGKDLDPLYWWQIQGYLALTGAKSGEVSYCLVDTPEVILNQEKQWLFRRMDVATEINPEYVVAEAELVNNMTFAHDMPHKDRRIKFTVQRDDEAIEKIYRRVDKCREYMAEVERLHQIGTFEAKETENEIGELE